MTVSDSCEIWRFVPPARIALDPDDETKVVGVYPAAFMLREGEAYLSTTCPSVLSADSAQQPLLAVQAMQALIRGRIGSAFAIGVVGSIKEACACHGYRIRVVLAGKPYNPGYTELRQWPRVPPELFERLAENEWSRLLLIENIQGAKEVLGIAAPDATVEPVADDPADPAAIPDDAGASAQRAAGAQGSTFH